MTWKRSFDAIFVNTKSGSELNGTERVDLCCRTFHKCDAFKRETTNHTFDITNKSYIRHCGCENSFKKCLSNLNTTLSNEIAFMHSLNSTKCYTRDHPIIKCNQTFNEHSELKSAPLLGLMNSTEREMFLKRCLKYDVDKSQPQQLQVFDVPFNIHAMSAFKCRFVKQKQISERWHKK